MLDRIRRILRSVIIVTIIIIAISSFFFATQCIATAHGGGVAINAVDGKLVVVAAAISGLGRMHWLTPHWHLTGLTWIFEPFDVGPAPRLINGYGFGFKSTNQQAVISIPLWFLAALAWFLLSAAPMLRSWRRRRRARRGLCLNCGYDLRSSNGLCPECGSG
jgi:hypothetical protein